MKHTVTAINTSEVVKQVEQMAELARIGQDFVEASACFSKETIEAMINDVASSGKLHLLSFWPSSMFSAIK